MADVIKRKYNMTDGALRQLASNLKYFANRDLTYLAPIGISADTITIVANLYTAFVELPYDMELLNVLKATIRAKNNKQKEILDVIGLIHSRAKIVFKEDPATFAEFRFNEINSADDDAFPTQAIMIARTAAAHLTALANQAQTQAELTNLTAKCEELIVLMTNVQTAERNRREAKDARILAGNALYDVLGDIAIAGKSVFGDTSATKFVDYLLYPDAHVPKTPPPQVNGVGYASPNIFWNEAANALYYKVEVSYNSGATYQLYEDNVEDPQLEVETPVQGTAMYRVIAVNVAGQSEPSAPVTLVGSVGAPGGISYDNNGFHVTPVAGAEEYQILYGPPGGSVDAPSTIEVSVSTSPDYSWTFPYTGTWVFYVRVKVGGVWGSYLVQEITFA